MFDFLSLLFRTEDGLDLKYIFEGHSLGVMSIDINNDGTVAASQSLDSHIRLWNLESGEQVQSIEASPVNAWTVAFSPDSKSIASCAQSGKIILYSSATGQKEKEFDSTGKFTMCLSIVSMLHFDLLMLSSSLFAEKRWQTDCRRFDRRDDQVVRRGEWQDHDHLGGPRDAHSVFGLLGRRQISRHWLR